MGIRPRPFLLQPCKLTLGREAKIAAGLRSEHGTRLQGELPLETVAPRCAHGRRASVRARGALDGKDASKPRTPPWKE